MKQHPQSASGSPLNRRTLLKLAGAGVVAGTLGYYTIRRVATQASVKHSLQMMGTIVNMVVCGETEAECHEGINACIARMESLSSMMSTYVEDSPLSELNRAGVLTDAPPEMIEVLALSRELSELTNGAFDPTVLPLVGLYREIRKTGTLPDEKKVKEILPLVDYRHIVVENGTTVRYRRPGVAVTLDAIAKGYVVDRGIDVLRERGVSNAFVEAGGDLMVIGHRPDGNPWKIGIRNPRSDDLRKMDTIDMSDRAIATSGDYMQYFTDDRKVHHIINPLTGFSPVRTASSSILAPTVAKADGLATATMVMAPETSIALLESLPDCEGYLFDKQLNRYQTTGFFS